MKVRHTLALPSTELGDGLFNLGGDAAMRVIDMAQLVAARCAVVLETPIPVKSAAPRADERSDDLIYASGKLQATGFRLLRNHAAEIDATLRICVAAFGKGHP